jgi:tetratricopeptide (TPR) repeat protein
MGNSHSQLSPSVPATNSPAERRLFQKLEQLPQVAERSALFHLELGKNAQNRKEWRLALEHYALGLSCAPKELRTLYLLYNNSAHCRNMLGFYAEAEHYCRLAIETDSKQQEAYINLGISLCGQRDPTGVGRCFAEAMEANSFMLQTAGIIRQLLLEYPTSPMQCSWIQLDLDFLEGH